ncbi:MAG TPA: AAA family ATPase [Thermoanaerobaculia bacterium]
MGQPSLTSRVLDFVTASYRASRDFNGIRYTDVQRLLGLIDPAMRRAVRTLVKRGAASAIFGDIHPNAYIRALPDEPIDQQLAKLTAECDPCLYPTEATLARVVPSNLHLDRPFTRRLALGEPQLTFAAFDLTVLETYRNDPRYVFHAGDAGGTISISDDYYESPEMPRRDQVLLQSFGFCYGPDSQRAVGVFLRYLSGLSPEHQQLWRTRILPDGYKLHPDYWASSMGHWPEGASIFEAVLAEMRYINGMARAMGRRPLFKRDFEGERPVEFAFLFRPTRAEFDTFVQTLDKMLSDNIDPKFFRGEVPTEFQETRPDGMVEVKRKGTITMLEEWIGAYFRSSDPSVPALFKTLRHVRELRSHPAHAVRANVFDKTLFETQRQLMIDVYQAVQTLRLIFAYWPETKSCEVPRILRGGTTIWTM